MTTVQQQIEQYLREYPSSDGWVKSKVLCARFSITDRQLRAAGKQQGLCGGFAISGDKGFKHIDRASTTEYLRFKHRLLKHAVNEFRRVADLDQRRRQVTKTTKRPEFIREKDTNQGLLFSIPMQRPF